MNRKSFIQKLVAGIGVTTIGRIPEFTPEVDTAALEILVCQVAGYQFHKGAQVESKFRIGTPLLLVREPDNPYDECAIAIYFEQTKVGYIPRACNFVLARMLSGGVSLKVKIFELNKHQASWERVWISVTMDIDAKQLQGNDLSGKRDSNSKKFNPHYVDFSSN